MQSNPSTTRIAYRRKMGPISLLEMFRSFKMVNVAQVTSTELIQAVRKSLVLK